MSLGGSFWQFWRAGASTDGMMLESHKTKTTPGSFQVIFSARFAGRK
jgi:hypothetical protein